MGESSACLKRSFSHPSPSSSDEKKGNPLQRALTTSVSFGRFVSESLDWEKWSAFTHNRYMEEIEKYSKPGSVAEKKAYFEAHFKRRRAAAMLEQQNASDNDISEINTGVKDKDNFPSGIENAKHKDEPNNGPVFSVGQNGTSEEAQPEGGNENVTQPPFPAKIHVEITKHLENAECNGDTVSEEDNDVCEKDDDSSKRTSAVLSMEKSEVFPSNLSTNNGGISVKQMMPLHTRTSVKTLYNKKAMEPNNKGKSSLHMSVNFVSCSQKATSPAPPKLAANPRLVKAPAKKYKNSTDVPEASTRTSVSGIFKHLSAAPPVENRRTVTDQESPSLQTCLKGKHDCQLRLLLSRLRVKKEQQNEERQKLEEKLTLKETGKHKQAKSQVKAISKFKDLQSSIASKAIENAEPPRTKLPPSYLKKKVPTDKPCFPKVEDWASSKMEGIDSRPPWRVSVKTQGLNDGMKHGRAGKYILKNTKENASPNIPLV
ncbi:TPX2 (targeting protein for Xklp2) proteinfamily [Striga asiatica]|uniref:TPX2 (Targeting protein for Xklp2) proteinfamily n=1 Tax=Striga asiatica TaxID=4170 RepID=A0A5A7QRY0_STRAF|nr:TPX2 (targeting protein for Xklp2) proteinfamily [Striga asiatica]